MENNTKDRKLSQEYTFEELHKGALSEIPTTSGVYFVLMPENYKIAIKEETDGFQLTSKGKTSAYAVEELMKKANHYGNSIPYSSNILYIGKARDLQRRIEQYVGYRYRDLNLFPHDGGRAIWQLENNEKLIIRYLECKENENCRNLEHSLLCTYKEKHGAYPFANWKA